MPQAKLKLDAKEFAKLPAAAALSGCTMKESYKATNQIHVEVAGRSVEALMDLSATLATITPEEVEAHNKRVEAKKAKVAPAKVTK